MVWYLSSFSQSLVSKIEELKNAFSNIKFRKDMNEAQFIDEKHSLYLQLDGYLIVLIQFKITETSSNPIGNNKTKT